MDVGEKISICTPCRNRTFDLKLALPTWIRAANASLPVEIVILDYNSSDDLQEYIFKMMLADYPCDIRYEKYTGRNYYHMAHARNLSILETTSKYFIQVSADSLMSPDFIEIVRKLFTDDVGWITIHRNEGIMVMRKQDFIDAGGYDERFELYGPEDKDLNARLIRRGLSVMTLPLDYVGGIFTPNDIKRKNYRLDIDKVRMSKLMTPIYYENINNNVLVANEGQEWGKWI